MTDSIVISTFKDLMVAEAKYIAATSSVSKGENFKLHDLEYSDFEVVTPHRSGDRIEITVFFNDGVGNQRMDMEVRKGFPLDDDAYQEIYDYDWTKPND